MKADQLVYMNVGMPSKLRERAGVRAKKRRASIAALICEALDDKLNALDEEDKARINKERAQAAAAEAEKSGRTSLTLPSQEGFAPAPPPPPSAPDAGIYSGVVSDGGEEDKSLYIEYARFILEALDQPQERNRRTAAAVDAIKRRRPLTHPGDRTILQRLEACIVDMRSNGLEPSVLLQLDPAPSPSPATRLLDKILSRLDSPSSDK